MKWLHPDEKNTNMTPPVFLQRKQTCGVELNGSLAVAAGIA